MDAELKAILLRLVDELQDLRANVGLLAACADLRISQSAAQDAKSVSIPEIAKQYAGLRKLIEGSK